MIWLYSPGLMIGFIIVIDVFYVLFLKLSALIEIELGTFCEVSH